MPARPRVAVVVPVHNGVAFLAEAVDSILAQSLEAWEAVLVDDCSSDESPALAARLAAAHPERITTLRLAQNVGVAGARNAGIAATGAPLVALLDQDDRLLPGYLERCVALHDEAVAAGRRAGVVACNAVIADGDGELTGETFAERYWWSDVVDLDGMMERNLILARAVVARAALDDVGGFSPACRASDDYDLWLRLLEAGWEVVTTREALAVYRIHGAAQSRDQRFMADGAIAAFERALERGRLTPPQRRAMRARIRHARALRARALVHEAAAEGRIVRAGARALRAAPYGAVALLQAPRRWPEWARDAVRGEPAGTRTS